MKDQTTWAMQWRVLVYGSLDPSRTRRAAIDALLGSIVLAVYGLWVEFVPSEPVAKFGTYLAVAISLSLGLFISRGYATGRFQWHQRPPALARLLCYAFIFAGIYCLAWLIVVRAAPDLATRLFGTYQSKTMVLESSDHRRRNSCDHQLQSTELAFPGYLCAPFTASGPFAPRGEVILSGKSTLLGLHVTQMEPGVK